MKKTLSLVSGIILMCIVFVSCDKDDETPGIFNHMKYDSVKYPLKTALLQYFGKTANNHYEFDFYALSPTITVYDESGKVDSAAGVGEVVYIKLFSEDAEGLKPGTYLYDNANTQAAGTFSLGLFAINYDIGLDNGENVHILKSGKVGVKKIGNTYKIGFMGVDQYDKEIVGYYIGPVGVYDHSQPSFARTKKSFFF